MHKSATKCNETIGKWCKNKHGASKIIDTFETYQLTGLDQCRNSTLMPGFNDIGLKEVVAITSWYIWWIRQRRTRNEDVAPIFKRKMSSLAIASNSAKAMTFARPT
jgi:hypothetical protein